MKRQQFHTCAVSLAVLLTGYSAVAQQASAAASFGAQGQAAAAPPPAPAPVPPPTGVTPDPAPPPAAQHDQAGMVLPAAANANTPTGNSEHDDMVGHLAIGFLGRNTIPYGVGPTSGTAAADAQVPVIGVRYWLDPLIGLDLGAGLWIGGASSEATNPAGVTTPSVSGPRPTSFILHAGVPLALASSKHFAFEVIPEANLGYAKVAQDNTVNAAGMTKQAGTHFDLGARAGAEIHFGFIGIPQLSLVGSVGLRFQYDKLTTELNPPGGAGLTTQNVSIWSLGTTVNDSPWNIFVSNVSALYYL